MELCQLKFWELSINTELSLFSSLLMKLTNTWNKLPPIQIDVLHSISTSFFTIINILEFKINTSFSVVLDKFWRSFIIYLSSVILTIVNKLRVERLTKYQ